MIGNPLTKLATTAIINNIGSKKDSANDLNFLDQKQIALKIPLSFDSKKLKKLLESSTIIKSIDVSELQFKTADWVDLSKGIVKNKSVLELRFHAIDITQENIAYITDIIQSNSRIESIRFDNWTITADSFDALGEAMKTAPKLSEIEISEDNLTEEQIQKLKSTFEASKSLKRLSFIRDPVYIATNKAQVFELTEQKKKFLITGLTELLINRNDCTNRYLTNALKSNQTIKTIELRSSLLISQWKNISEGIAENFSITKLKLYDTYHDVVTAPIFCKIFDENDRITELIMRNIKISDSAAGPMIDVIRSKKIKRVKIAEMMSKDFDEFVEAAYMNDNITSLSIAHRSIFPNRVTDLIYNCQHITDLRLGNGEFKQDEIQDRKIAYLTRLDLGYTKDIPKNLLEAVKFSESLKELNLTSATYKNTLEQITDILSVNPRLNKLSVLMPVDEQGFQTLMLGLTNNRSLKALEIPLPNNSIQALCQALLSNSTLERLAIQTSHQNVNEEYYSSLGNVLLSNSTIRSIRLPILIEKSAATNLIAKLKNNDTLTHLDLVLQTPTFTSNHVYSELTEVLKTNQALNSVTTMGEMKKKVTEMAEKNKRKQEKIVRRAYAMMNMMKLRLDAFESMLPVELWMMIFDQIRHPGVNINFSQELVKILNQ